MPEMNQRHTYFVPANFDNPPPPDGPLKLGQLVSAPENPGRPADPTGPEPLATHNVKVHTNSTAFILERDKANHIELGLFAKALQHVGLLKLGVHFSHSDTAYALDAIKTLDVEFIEPDRDYIKASMERTKVKEALKRLPKVRASVTHPLRKSLYMITGIKTAHPEAILVNNTASSTSASANASAAGPAGAGTAGGGGNAAGSDSNMRALTLIPKKPFVYGYRLLECYYNVLGHLKDEEFVDGAVFDENSDDELDEDVEDGEEETDQQYEFGGFQEYDVTDARLWGVDGKYGRVGALDEETNQECTVLLVRK